MITVSKTDARRLLLGAQGLLDDPARASSAPSALLKLIERMGFVQIDTINVIERAHHLILASRIDSYDRASLDALLHPKRAKLFEHWTHDASLIPTKWWPHWRARFDRYRAMGWHRKKMGTDGDKIVADVLARIRRDGPLMSRHFEHVGERDANAQVGAWWGWKPQKVALDYLWRIGELYVVGRENFQKIYDIAERVVPQLHAQRTPSDVEHIEWACRSALQRLGIATAPEVANFWRAIKLAPARKWLSDAVTRGEVIKVALEGDDKSAARQRYALPDLKRRIAKLPDPPARTRLLCPFDPVVRDRARALRLFDFHYRFEAFVPKANRRHGYYVMPILEGDRLIGRLDPKLHRDRGELEIRFVDFEPGVKVDRKRRASVDKAVQRLADFVDAKTIRWPRLMRKSEAMSS
ncbi:MAG: YcaQ family DNA glycosylase [Anaerolineae bacterium]|nr:YcaQ family DNA glycosylase [Phycisphaerae bacterium]